MTDITKRLQKVSDHADVLLTDPPRSTETKQVCDEAIQIITDLRAERDAALLRLKVYEEEDAVINRKFLDITDKRCAELEKALNDLVGCYNEFQQSSGNMEEAYYKLVKYAYPQWQAAQAALNSESARA